MLHTEGHFFSRHCHETIDQIADELIENARQDVPPYRAPIVLSESISLVQQHPWIQNKSIKDNILFGSRFDPVKYAETIKICQLKRDLEILPSGDQTEIGEKGINLSGGQKARISLARAVYADKETVLMDDPLSALDSNVKKRIFKLVMMRKLQNKTRVLVTHAVDFLHLADSIICLKDGKIEFQGNYQEVKSHPYLKELVRIHHGHLADRQSYFSDQIHEEVKEGATQILTSVNDDEDDDVIDKVNLDQVPSDSDDESARDSESDQEDQGIQEENDVGYVKKRTFSVDLGNASEDAKRKKGQITTNENEEEARVTWDTYKRYQSYAGGIK